MSKILSRKRQWEALLMLPCCEGWEHQCPYLLRDEPLRCGYGSMERPLIEVTSCPRTKTSSKTLKKSNNTLEVQLGKQLAQDLKGLRRELISPDCSKAKLRSLKE